MIYNRSNLLNAYFQRNNPQSELNQRQRINKSDEIDSSVRKPKIISVFSELNEQSSNINHQYTIKKNLHRQSPILIRRYRPTIENISSHQQSSDINDVLGYQLQLTIPQHPTVRSKSSRTSLSSAKSLNYPKTTSENISKPKLAQRLQTPIWTPTLTVKELTHTRTLNGLLRSKSHSPGLYNSRYHTPQLRSEKSNLGSKQNYIPDLFISPRSMNNNNNELEMYKKTNVKELVDEWEDPKSNVADLSDEEEKVVTDDNCPTLSSNHQNNLQHYDHSTFPNFMGDQQHLESLSIDNSKLQTHRSRPRLYSIVLPSVAEHEELSGEFY